MHCEQASIMLIDPPMSAIAHNDNTDEKIQAVIFLGSFCGGVEQVETAEKCDLNSDGFETR